jgi:hypothetical protein
MRRKPGDDYRCPVCFIGADKTACGLNLTGFTTVAPFSVYEENRTAGVFRRFPHSVF